MKGTGFFQQYSYIQLPCGQKPFSNLVYSYSFVDCVLVKEMVFRRNFAIVEKSILLFWLSLPKKLVFVGAKGVRSIDESNLNTYERV